MASGLDQEKASDEPLNAEAMLRAEFRHVLGDSPWRDHSRVPLSQLFHDMHAGPAEQRPSALCLSGGGIRSATFCLGVLQWLAGQHKLRDFHYISTVSGGGYIGGWLVNGLCQAEQPDQPGAENWLNRVGQSAGSVDAARASGAARTDGDTTDPVAPLRAFSNYLSPTGGLSGDAFSLAAIFIRNLLLNALVWLSLLAAIVALPRLYIAVLNAAPHAERALALQWGVVGLALAAIVAGVAYVVADLPAPSAPSPAPPTPLNDHFYRACFTPIVLAAIVLSIGGAWIATLRGFPLYAFAIAGALAHLSGVVVGVPLRLLRGHGLRQASVRGVIVVVFVGAVGGALASIALSQLGANPGAADPDSQRLIYASFAVPAMTGAFWLAMALYAGLMGRITDEQDREWWARATAAWLKFSLAWMLAFALVVWLPMTILDHLGSTGPTAVQFGVGGGVLGVLTSLIGYWSKNGGDLKRKAEGLLRVTRLKLLDAMAVTMVLAMLLALSMGWSATLDGCHGWKWTASLCPADLHAQTEFLREQKLLRAEHATTSKSSADAAGRAEVVLDSADNDAGAPVRSAAAHVYQHILLGADWRILSTAVTILLLVAAGLAAAMGVNHFSLHGMYGNRLVRAYLGSGRPQRHPHWFTGFDPDDNPKLAALKTPLRGSDKQVRLFPVINIALNLVRPSPKHLDWQQRKAAPFIATPLYCGAANVGYRRTDGYAGGMSLGRAMTISGAAASPNMGYHSSALVTFVMTLFNVRLGWWSPNPGPASGSRWNEAQPRLGLGVTIAEASGSTGEDAPFVYLSDGGHFDNLGIYEMVRRRCHRIVVVDATCDGEFKWTDLLEVVRKVRVDFGIPIELPPVLPGPGRNTASARCVEADIRYSARDGNDPKHDGKLIVLKPRLLPEQDPPELAAYAASSVPDGTPADDPARFPHQSTADQFYDEQQFESYRLLGYLTAADTLDGEPRAMAAAPATTTPGGRAHASCVAGPAAGGMAGLAGAGGVGHFIQQVGTGTALAAALTIGGTLGVAGTVALAPNELTLSEADRALLKGGLSLRVDSTALRLNDEDRRMLGDGIRVTADGSALNDPAQKLSAAAKSLDTAAGKFNESTGKTTVVFDQSLSNAMQTLTYQINDLKGRIRDPASSTPATGTPTDLTSAVVALRRTLDSIDQKMPADPRWAESLNQLKGAVDGIAPRRNVRGQDGGGR